jgi:hypothetical protein
MRQFARRIWPTIVLLSALCGCRASARPRLAKELVTEIPPQILLQVRVIALREAPGVSEDAPFPALGFRFAGDWVVPVEDPDTIAGVELTAPQLSRWAANLAKAGAVSYAEPGFTVGPNHRASSIYSTEKLYQANWRVDTDSVLPETANIIPESKFSVQPELVPGTRDLLTSVDAETGSGGLDPFTLVDNFAAKDRKPAPLALFLPRQVFLRMATQTLVKPGRTLVLAHYVKQYRSAPQPSKPAQNLRDHIFYLLSTERRGPEEAPSNLPIVPQIPPCYALSLIWLEAGNPAPAEQPPKGAVQAPRRQTARAATDWDSLLKMARRIQDQPDAAAQTLSLALTVKTQAQFEVAEERGYVAGIHPDSEKPASPYDFLINRTWTGAKLSAQLAPGAPGMSAALNLRLADPPQYADALGPLPSLSPGTPEKEAKEYRFQAASQTSADYAATEVLRLGHTRLLPLTWQTTGTAASQNAPLRSVAAILQEPAARY